MRPKSFVWQSSWASMLIQRKWPEPRLQASARQKGGATPSTGAGAQDARQNCIRCRRRAGQAPWRVSAISAPGAKVSCLMVTIMAKGDPWASSSLGSQLRPLPFCQKASLFSLSCLACLWGPPPWRAASQLLI